MLTIDSSQLNSLDEVMHPIGSINYIPHVEALPIV
jgi:hypothetical protein